MVKCITQVHGFAFALHWKIIFYTYVIIHKSVNANKLIVNAALFIVASSITT